MLGRPPRGQSFFTALAVFLIASATVGLRAADEKLEPTGELPALIAGLVGAGTETGNAVLLMAVAGEPPKFPELGDAAGVGSNAAAECGSKVNSAAGLEGCSVTVAFWSSCS